MTSAPRSPRYCTPAGPKRNCVKLTMRMPFRISSALILEQYQSFRYCAVSAWNVACSRPRHCHVPCVLTPMLAKSLRWNWEHILAFDTEWVNVVILPRCRLTGRCAGLASEYGAISSCGSAGNRSRASASTWRSMRCKTTSIPMWLQLVSADGAKDFCFHRTPRLRCSSHR